MTRKIRVVGLLAAAGLIVGLVAGGAFGRTTGTAAGKSVCFVTYSNSTPWAAGVNKQFDAAMAKAGVKVLATLTDAENLALESQHFNQCIALHPNVIVIGVDDPNATVAMLHRAKSAGIGVIAYNSPMPAAAKGLYVTTDLGDNKILGTYAGQTLVAGLQHAGYKKANIMLIEGTASMQIVQQRNTAFDAVLKKYPQYKVVATQDSNWDIPTSERDASQIFAQYKSRGGIQGAYGTADYMAMAIVSAANQAGLKTGNTPGHVVVVGSNCTYAGAKAMVSGVLSGDATYTPTEQVASLAPTVLAYLSGKKLPALVAWESKKITPANAKQLLPACNY
ncbi:MAG TPA: sugar ABC transporter substrate-binding protein [Gaiellaceae bacterium]